MAHLRGRMAGLTVASGKTGNSTAKATIKGLKASKKWVNGSKAGGSSGMMMPTLERRRGIRPMDSRLRNDMNFIYDNLSVTQ